MNVKTASSFRHERMARKSQERCSMQSMARVHLMTCPIRYAMLPLTQRAILRVS